MSQPPPPGSEPDWGLIGGAFVTFVTILAAAVAGAKGAIGRGKKKPADEPVRTLENVFLLIDQLQEEVKRRGQDTVDVERRCDERIARLEKRISGLEQLGQAPTTPPSGGTR